MPPSFLPGLAPLATAASAWWTQIVAPAWVRTRSANPVWSACAWVSTTASMSPAAFPRAASARWSRPQSAGVPASTTVSFPPSSIR